MPNKQIKIKPPEYLFRYLSYKGLVKTLENLSIRCAPALTFNDPFDCTPPFKFKDTCSKNCIISNRYGTTCESSIKCVTEKCYVGCFTTEPDNILMWGHYTDNYKGGVIKIRRNIFMLKHTQKVNYTNKIPEISTDLCFNKNQKFSCTNASESINALYLTKHPNWKYENEWRFLSHIYNLKFEIENTDIKTFTDPNKRKKFIRTKNNILRYNKVIIPLSSDDIVEIYLGFRNENIERIKNIIKEKNINAKLYIITPKENEFALTKHKINLD